MSKYQQFKQGIYKPIYPDKVKNAGQIKYRSSLELKLFIWCDKNARVLEWGSENVIIPYISPLDKQAHRYFVDLYIKIKEQDKIRKCLVEIKPYNQTKEPTTSKRKKKATILYEQATWAVNKAKWEAAKKYANDYNMEFLVITEIDLEKMYK